MSIVQPNSLFKKDVIVNVVNITNSDWR